MSDFSCNTPPGDQAAARGYVSAPGEPAHFKRNLLVLFLAFALAACSSSTPTPTAAPLSTSVMSAPDAAATPTTAPVEPASTTVSLTPTGNPITIYFLGTEAPDALQTTAQKFGWRVEQRAASVDSARATAQAGAKVIVVDRVNVVEVAREFAQTHFINLNVAVSGDLPSNTLILGGPTDRYDQAGFLAGMVAGFATATQRVAAVTTPTSPEALKYRNGFVSGVRYACARCRIDLIDLADTQATDFANTEAAKYASYGVDVLFTAAGAAGESALFTAARSGVWVIGSGRDVNHLFAEPGSWSGQDHALTSVYIDPGEALAFVLKGFNEDKPLTGAQPLSLANGGVMMAPYTNADAVLSPLDRQDIETARARLASGALETGVDPLTGAER